MLGFSHAWNSLEFHGHTCCHPRLLPSTLNDCPPVSNLTLANTLISMPTVPFSVIILLIDFCFHHNSAVKPLLWTEPNETPRRRWMCTASLSLCSPTRPSPGLYLTADQYSSPWVGLRSVPRPYRDPFPQRKVVQDHPARARSLTLNRYPTHAHTSSFPVRVLLWSS